MTLDHLQAGEQSAIVGDLYVEAGPGVEFQS
jgi:hypothetical protein